MPPSHSLPLEPDPELPAILRLNAGATCLACLRENAPRVDDIPFCSSCVEAGWDVAYTRGANAAFDAMLEAVKGEIVVMHDDPEIETIPDGVVHVLRYGRALCGQPGLPVDWPAGHCWISFEDTKIASAVTCAKCKAELPR